MSETIIGAMDSWAILQVVKTQVGGGEVVDGGWEEAKLFTSSIILLVTVWADTELGIVCITITELAGSDWSGKTADSSQPDSELLTLL